MANKSYLPTSHRLLSGYAALTSPRGSLGASSRGASPPPEFPYDVYHQSRETPRTNGGSREASSYNNRAPSSPGSASLTMAAYSSVQDFPYGLSGVQMPTYNFGSELYNYVSNGFPRKSRMCTFCNKVFTRSTTRRYHERRCPLLRASNSLAKNEENNSSTTSSLAALKEQQLQQRQKEARNASNGVGGGGGGGGLHSSIQTSSLPRTLASNIINTMTAQQSLSQTSPPLPALHPAYPTSFPKASPLANSASRSGAYGYAAHPYSSHFYNQLSAAALASLDQNCNKQQQQQQQQQQQHDSDTASWLSSASPPSSSNNGNKLHDQLSPFNSKLNSVLTGGGPLALSKAFTPEAVVDLTARYCADFSLRTRPPVFPAPSLRAPPHSPPSPEPGETLKGGDGGHHGRDSPVEIVAATTGSISHHNKLWTHPPHHHNNHNNHNNSHHNNNNHHHQHSHHHHHHQDNGKPSQHHAGYPTLLSSSSVEEDDETNGHRRRSTSPSPEIWQHQERGGSVDAGAVEPPRPYMKVEPLDEEDEEEFEDEEDEDEVEEDEEQFKTEGSLEGLDPNDDTDAEVRSLSYKGVPYNPLVCQFCKKSFSDIITRKAHEALHSQKKLFACCLCSHSFHCAYSLRIHTLRHHKDGPYKCKYCFIDYETRSALRFHLSEEHSLPKSEFQSLKYFSLTTSDNEGGPSSPSPRSSILITNAVSDGEHGDDFTTSNGYHGINSNSDKPQHHRRSAGNPESQYTFSDATTKAVFSSNINTTNITTTTITTNSNNNNGINGIPESGSGNGKHSGSGGKTNNGSSNITSNGKLGAEEGMETCKVCNKSFTKSYIRLHERTHADQKPYECPICNKRFGYKNNMKSHMKLHQGLKPYQCQICGARFTRGSTLRRHGRRHNISHGAMLDYVLYDQRQRGRGRGGGGGGNNGGNAGGVGGKNAACLSQKANIMVPSSTSAEAKSHYNNILPSQSNGISSVVGVGLGSLSASVMDSSQSAIISGKHASAFSAMPSLIHAASGMVDVADRYAANSNNNNNNGNGNNDGSSASAKQRSPPVRISPPHPNGGLHSPRGTGNPFASHGSMSNPMVGGLAAVAAANLFGYPNAAAAAAAAPHLYQFYASAASNPLLSYPQYSAAQNPQNVQSDALNLSLGKRKSPEKDIQMEEQNDYKHARTAEKLSSLRASPDQPTDFTTTTASDKDKERIKIEPNSHHEDYDNLSSSSSSPHGKEKKNPFTVSPTTVVNGGHSPQNDNNNDHLPNSNTHESADDDDDNDNDKEKWAAATTTKDGRLATTMITTTTSTTSTHGDNDEDDDDDDLNNSNDLKIPTEDFGAQVNICCPSPRVQSSTGGSLHQSLPNSPVGSSSGPDGHLHQGLTTTSTGSPGGLSRQSSSSPANSAPSPTPNDPLTGPGQDLLLSLLNSGRLFRCSYCDIYFTEYAMFRLHQKYHQCDLARPFLCAVCGEDCKDKTYFTVHLSEHLGLGPKNCLP